MEKASEQHDVDTSCASRGVWLVKVPNYMSERWKRAGPNNEVGKLRISKPKFVGGKPEVIFSLNDTLSGKITGEEKDILKDHQFFLTGVTNQSLNILAEGPSDASIQEAGDGNPVLDKIAIEGKVMQRAECKPIVDANYMKLKKTQMEQQNKPVRKTIEVDIVSNTYKPVSNHQHIKDYEKRKKEEGKRSRGDKEQVMDMLFSAFEKFQYYNIKHLVTITKQPVTFLKEILKEICIYNMKAPHKNMWELKPEYAHYSSK